MINLINPSDEERTINRTSGQIQEKPLRHVQRESVRVLIKTEITGSTRYTQPMARPSGQFDQQRDRCYSLIKGLAGLGYCFATSKYLSKRMGVGTKQIQRYLSDLKKRGKIEVRTGPARLDTKTGKLFRKRFIRSTEVPNDYSVKMPFKLIILGPAAEEIEEFEYISTADEQARAALEALRAEREAKEAAIAFSDSLNPDKQYDEAAILRELQAELADSGIQMEL